jgi:hypothetical protein
MKGLSHAYPLRGSQHASPARWRSLVQGALSRAQRWIVLHFREHIPAGADANSVLIMAHHGLALTSGYGE